MNNHDLIAHFYLSFQKKDYQSMQACYDDNANFSDPVFTNLNATQVRAMWEMFCLRGKDLSIHFKDITQTEKGGSVTWIAHYTFTTSGKRVVNTINANFVIRNGKIVSHIDNFNFYNWARQALGVKGFLLGWTSFVKKKVQKSAMHNLHKFIQSK